MSRVWDYSKQEGTKLLLLLALADFARDDGRAWPSVKTLAKKARCGKRNAQYILREIAKDGEIAIAKETGPRGTNLYTVLVGVQPIAPPIYAEGVQPIAGGGAIQRTKGVQPIAPEPLITIIEPLLKEDKAKKIPEAVKVFRENAARYPAKSWYATLDSEIGKAEKDLKFWGEVVHGYVGMGWNPGNVSNMLEFYKRREIPGGGNGKGPPSDDGYDERLLKRRATAKASLEKAKGKHEAT